VSLRLPKLSLNLQAELTPVLNTLGVRTVFTNDADLSGISDDPLAVQAVLHETVLKLDEQGLEGAAATAVMMRVLSFNPQEPVEVVVDRPFLLLVRHTRTGAVYFSARVTDPS
jgi:serine protease inhibitor